MGVYDPTASVLLYGMGGAGKTPLAVSSFWDWKRGRKICNGKYITFGAEDNPALMIPEEFRHTDKGTSLRLTSPLLDSTAFLTEFDRVTRRFVLDAEEGHPIDVLVIDGLTEFDLLFEETYADTGDNFAKWNALLSQMYSMMLRTSHNVMGCPVIMTARVMERKKGTQSRTMTIGGDPGFVDYDYYPSLRGSFRLQLPHYFGLVLYLETAQEKLQDGRVVPTHIVNMYRTGDFFVKNQFEYAWIKAGKAAKLVNPDWPDLWEQLTDVVREAHGAQDEQTKAKSQEEGAE